jgi:hypothetical protein
VLERLALKGLVAKRDLAADRSGRSERNHFGHRETALGQNIEHLVANIAGGAGDRDLEA